MAKIKTKKADPKYVLTLSRKELLLLQALLDFPDWDSQGDVGEQLEKLHAVVCDATGVYKGAASTFESSKASFTRPHVKR